MTHVKKIELPEIWKKISLAGGHCGLSTIYMKHNLFIKSKIGCDIDLQNIYTVQFSSRGYVQLGLRSSLVDSLKDTTSVPFVIC